MHPTAMANAKRFFDTYVSGRGAPIIVDVGSQDVNGSLKEVSPPEARYIGVDFQEAKGVDIVLTDPYSLPFENESVDAVVCSSCFEHSEMFWLVFLEVLRILKPNGLFYVNVPSNGLFHRFPVDCWRFYPDSGRALVTWAKRSGINAALLESYTSHQKQDVWNDFVAVFLKDETHAAQYPRRITDTFSDYDNGIVYGRDTITKIRDFPEDMRRQNSLFWIAARVLTLAASPVRNFWRRAKRKFSKSLMGNR